VRREGKIHESSREGEVKKILIDLFFTSCAQFASSFFVACSFCVASREEFLWLPSFPSHQPHPISQSEEKMIGIVGKKSIRMCTYTRWCYHNSPPSPDVCLEGEEILVTADGSRSHRENWQVEEARLDNKTMMWFTFFRSHCWLIITLFLPLSLSPRRKQMKKRASFKFKSVCACIISFTHFN
jgi:hypothetical protein